MGEFWDARAREDAFFFVDDRLDYRNPDVERFWAGGVDALDALLAAAGARLRPGDAVVDIGCGLGRVTRAAASRVARVDAIDVSEEMLRRARDLNRELTNVRWHHGNGTDLAPLADASADVCVSHVVFQHIPDPAITLGYVREMGRVLRPGGWAAFVVSNDPAIHRPSRAPLRQRLSAWIGRTPRGREDRAWLGSAVDLDDLADAASGAGLAVAQVDGAGTQYCTVLLRRQAPAT